MRKRPYDRQDQLDHAHEQRVRAFLAKCQRRGGRPRKAPKKSTPKGPRRAPAPWHFCCAGCRRKTLPWYELCSACLQARDALEQAERHLRSIQRQHGRPEKFARAAIM